MDASFLFILTIYIVSMKNRTKMMLHILENKSRAVDSLIQPDCLGRANWILFCKQPSEENALAYLNVDSPIFNQLLRYIARAESTQARLTESTVLKEIESLWAHYEQYIEPTLRHELLAGLGTGADTNTLIEHLLSGKRLKSQEREKLEAMDAQLGEVRMLRDLIFLKNKMEKTPVERHYSDVLVKLMQLNQEDIVYFFK